MATPLKAANRWVSNTRNRISVCRPIPFLPTITTKSAIRALDNVPIQCLEIKHIMEIFLNHTRYPLLMHGPKRPYWKSDTCLPHDLLPKHRLIDERSATPAANHIIPQPLVVNSCTNPMLPLRNISRSGLSVIPISLVSSISRVAHARSVKGKKPNFLCL